MGKLNVEIWYAREIMGCLGYTTWRRFKDAINRAMESCKSAEIEVSDHFADAVKMVEIGSNAVRDVDDAGFGRIRSKGDQALFGGRSTQEMKEKLGVSDKRPLADFLLTLTILMWMAVLGMQYPKKICGGLIRARLV